MPRYLVTSALPYANGPSHLGQVAGAYLPADIFVRFLRLSGEDVVYICGTDEHGKPITKRAIAEGVSPQVIVDRYHEAIKGEFARLRIEFDNFSGTARPAHHALSRKFFTELLENGYLREESEEIFWCETCNLSLADRDVEGTCPKCKDHIARGDECKKTGSWLQATDLIDPVCSVCGNPPVRRETRAWFLDLPELSGEIEAWLDTKTWWKDNVVSFVRAWIRDGLRLRSVTRDMPWGVPVPIEGVTDKVLYVWLDAPIGYISSTIEWAERIGQPERWKEYWLDEDTRLVHFIGKDNIPFHAVTWPATLMGRNRGKGTGDRYILPHDVPANEYLTLEGEPFATGRNWAVWTGEALDVVPPDVIRYCLAANAPENKDADFSWGELRDRNNTDLADTYGNLASRTLRFIQKYFDGVVPALDEPDARDLEMLRDLAAAPGRVGDLFRTYKVRAATSAIMDLARLGNRYYDAAAPWKSRSTDLRAAGNCMHVCVRILRALATLSWPVIPTAAEALFLQLAEEGTPVERGWAGAAAADPPLAGRRLGHVEILFRKLDDAFVEEQVRKLKGATVTQPDDATVEDSGPQPIEISYEDFAKLDIRIGVVLAAERIPKADKLLKLQIDLGDEQRQVLAGVAEWYQPEELVGKRVPILTNLAPRKIRGELSQGMMLAADGVGGAAILLQPQADTPPGSKVR